MTKKQIEAEVKRWQKLLRLDDWDIELRLIEAKHINDQEHLANCRVQIYKSNAIITIAREQADKEITACIIHELLHVAFHPIRDFFADIADELSVPAVTAFLRVRMDTFEEPLVARLEGAFLSLVPDNDQG